MASDDQSRPSYVAYALWMQEHHPYMCNTPSDGNLTVVLDWLESAGWGDVAAAEQRGRAELASVEKEREHWRALAMEQAEPCVLDHHEEPCSCWCPLHDCRIDDCETFKTVRAWLRQERAQGRAGAIADLRDRDAVIQWLARNRLRFDEGVSQRELHAAYLEDRREH